MPNGLSLREAIFPDYGTQLHDPIRFCLLVYILKIKDFRDIFPGKYMMTALSPSQLKPKSHRSPAKDFQDKECKNPCSVTST